MANDLRISDRFFVFEKLNNVTAGTAKKILQKNILEESVLGGGCHYYLEQGICQSFTQKAYDGPFGKDSFKRHLTILDVCKKLTKNKKTAVYLSSLDNRTIFSLFYPERAYPESLKDIGKKELFHELCISREWEFI